VYDDFAMLVCSLRRACELRAVDAMNSFIVYFVVAGSCFQFRGVVNSNSL
jgi:hypothetical protein